MRKTHTPEEFKTSISIDIDRDKTMSLPIAIRDGKLEIGPIAGQVPEPEAQKLKDFIQTKLTFKTVPGDKIIAIPLDTERKAVSIDLKELTDQKEIQLRFDDKTPVGNVIVSTTPPPGGLVLEQSARNLLIPTEIRKSFNATLSPMTVTLPAEEKIYNPRTDLHTHFAAIMTADIMIAAVKKKHDEGTPFQYPINLLNKVKIDLSIYFDTRAQYEEFIKSGKTFDITKFYDPKYTGNDTNRANLAKFREAMHIPRDKTIIFAEMEKVYDFRDPLIKDISLFSFYLEEIAKDYQKQGMTYAEISFSKVIDPAWLKIINEKMPELESKYGVTIRWLSPIARVAPKAKRETQVELFKNHGSKSPYVIGVDVLAAEINSTYDLLPHLMDVAEWAKSVFPNMVIRVHAGEFSYHPENIEGVVSLAEKYQTECPTLKFRVGHGVYKGHQDVFERMKILPNIIPEINMASNQALNSLGDIGAHTLFQYAAQGIPVVLGSDGHGLYQSTNSDLIKLLCYAKRDKGEGIDIAAFCQKLKETEEKHIDYVRAVSDERMTIFQRRVLNALKTPVEIIEYEGGRIERRRAKKVEVLQKGKEGGAVVSRTTVIPYDELVKKLGITVEEKGEAVITDPLTAAENAIFEGASKTLFDDKIKFSDVAWDQLFSEYSADKTRYNEEDDVRTATAQKAIETRRAEVGAFCDKYGIKLAIDRVNPLEAKEREEKQREEKRFDMTGKTPIMLNGMIFNDLEREIKLGRLKEVEAFIRTMLATLDPKQIYFATTGKDIGIQKMLHELVHEHNEANRGHPEKQFDMVGFLPGNTTTDELSPYLTHAVVVEDIASVYSLYEYIGKKIHDDHLKLITVGGGMWNKDLIQTVDNVIRDPYAPPPDLTKEQQLFLMTHVPGASQDKFIELPKHYGFNDYVKVLMRMNQPTPLFQGGAALSETQIKEAFDRAKAAGAADVEKLQGRVTSSTPAEIIVKIITGLEEITRVEKSTFVDLPADVQEALKDRVQMKDFIEKCEQGNFGAISNTKIYGGMSAQPIIAYQFVALATMFEIPVPEGVARIAAKAKPSEQHAISVLVDIHREAARAAEEERARTTTTAAPDERPPSPTTTIDPTKRGA